VDERPVGVEHREPSSPRWRWWAGRTIAAMLFATGVALATLMIVEGPSGRQIRGGIRAAWRQGLRDGFRDAQRDRMQDRRVIVIPGTPLPPIPPAPPVPPIPPIPPRPARP
jgi:hypothetical protein